MDGNDQFFKDFIPDAVRGDNDATLPTDLSSLDTFDWSEFFLNLAKKGVNARLYLLTTTLLFFLLFVSYLLLCSFF